MLNSKYKYSIILFYKSFVQFVCLQVYKGLDVATNKATEEETEGVPHHMMGTVDWGDMCNVHEYRKEALKIVSFFFLYVYIFFGQ